MDIKLMDQPALDALVKKVGTLSVEEQMKLYLKLRQGKAAITKHLDAVKDQYTLVMDTIENQMLAAAMKQDVTGFSCKGIGTSYIAEEMKVSIADDNAFKPFILKLGADGLDFFERRISTNFLKEHMKLNGGIQPPGLNIFRERVMRIRKAGEKPN